MFNFKLRKAYYKWVNKKVHYIGKIWKVSHVCYVWMPFSNSCICAYLESEKNIELVNIEALEALEAIQESVNNYLSMLNNVESGKYKDIDKDLKYEYIQAKQHISL